MKTLSIVLLVVAVSPLPPAAAADDKGSTKVSTECCDAPSRWAPRHDARDSELAITTRDGDATMLLTREVVAVQLSDRAFHRARKKLRDEEREPADHALGQVVKTVVLSGVRALLDHSAEVPVRQLRDMDYRDGRLRFTTEDGKPILGNLEINDRDVIEGFSERDSRAFVREFRRIKARTR